MIVGVFHHLLHVEQMGGVGGQVIVDALLITYIDEDTAEYTHV